MCVDRMHRACFVPACTRDHADHHPFARTPHRLARRVAGGRAGARARRAAPASFGRLTRRRHRHRARRRARHRHPDGRAPRSRPSRRSDPQPLAHADAYPERHHPARRQRHLLRPRLRSRRRAEPVRREGASGRRPDRGPDPGPLLPGRHARHGPARHAHPGPDPPGVHGDHQRPARAVRPRWDLDDRRRRDPSRPRREGDRDPERHRAARRPGR